MEPLFQKINQKFSLGSIEDRLSLLSSAKHVRSVINSLYTVQSDKSNLEGFWYFTLNPMAVEEQKDVEGIGSYVTEMGKDDYVDGSHAFGTDETAFRENFDNLVSTTETICELGLTNSKTYAYRVMNQILAAKSLEALKNTVRAVNNNDLYLSAALYIKKQD